MTAATLRLAALVAAALSGAAAPVHAQVNVPAVDVRDPAGMVVDDAGNRFVSDRAQRRVWVIPPNGKGESLADDIPFPGDLALDRCTVVVATGFGLRRVPVGLTGRVRTGGGDPVPNARLVVRALGSEAGSASPPVVTDADGRFTVPLDFLPCALAADARQVLVAITLRGGSDDRPRVVERTVPLVIGRRTQLRRHTTVELQVD